jgi:hypothetical protein
MRKKAGASLRPFLFNEKKSNGLNLRASPEPIFAASSGEFTLVTSTPVPFSLKEKG